MPQEVDRTKNVALFPSPKSETRSVAFPVAAQVDHDHAQASRGEFAHERLCGSTKLFTST